MGGNTTGENGKDLSKIKDVVYQIAPDALAAMKSAMTTGFAYAAPNWQGKPLELPAAPNTQSPFSVDDKVNKPVLEEVEKEAVKAAKAQAFLDLKALRARARNTDALKAIDDAEQAIKVSTSPTEIANLVFSAGNESSMENGSAATELAEAKEEQRLWGEVNASKEKAGEEFSQVHKYTSKEEKEREAEIRANIKAAQDAGDKEAEGHWNTVLGQFYHDTGLGVQDKANAQGDMDAARHAKNMTSHGDKIISDMKSIKDLRIKKTKKIEEYQSTNDENNHLTKIETQSESLPDEPVKPSSATQVSGVEQGENLPDEPVKPSGIARVSEHVNEGELMNLRSIPKTPGNGQGRTIGA